MKVHGKNGGVITFRTHVGNGEYKGHEFKLGVATTPAGDLLGLPVVSWDDGITVTFEMEDLIPKAYEMRGDTEWPEWSNFCQHCGRKVIEHERD